MELELIQEILNDAMEMAQGEDLPPSVDPEIAQAVVDILTRWVIDQTVDEDQSEEFKNLITSLVSSAVACAYIASKLESLQDTKDVVGGTQSVYVEPTHPGGQPIIVNIYPR
jgi:hypothetical protein